MLAVNYKKVVPCSLEVVLSQYYDYEHISEVHPETLGEYRLVSNEDGRAVYEQVWPQRRGRRRTSLVEHTFSPPNEMRFRFLQGLYRGVEVETRLVEHEDGTLVDETYYLPGLPNWPWLARLARPSIVRRVDQVWDEDLKVEVCHGGWPRVPRAAVDSLLSGMAPSRLSEALPERDPAEAAGRGRPLPLGEGRGEWKPGEVASREREWVDLGPLDSLGDAGARRFELEGLEVVVFRRGAELYALENRCPHTGGPLAIGRCDGRTVTCPWHGARFELATGKAMAGPAERDVATLRVRSRKGRVEIAARGH
jgi:nitrite reductase/ring-hydroxylating ferredoxin subunit